MMHRIKTRAIAAVLLAPSLAFAAPITTPWVAPGGGIAGKSVILGEGSALNGKTMLDLMNQVDANQVTANAAIPLTQKGAASGVAPLDKNGLMSAGVSGSVSAATATTTYSGSVARSVASKWSDVVNLKDLGLLLSSSSASVDALLIPNLLKNNTGSSQVVEVPAGVWPSQTIIPSNVGDTDYINVLGRLSLYPFFPIASHNIGMGVPYFGDGVLSQTHDSMDGGNTDFARVDSNGTSRGEYRPSMSFTLVGDTPNEPGSTFNSGQKNVVFNHVTTVNNTGNSQNVEERGRYMGLNGGREFDVNHWNHTEIYGTNWVWANINEMYEFVPFSSGDSGPVSPSYLFENDMGGVGPENIASAYDFTQSKRKMFWLTTNHNVNNDSNNSTDLSWQANTTFPADRLILKAGSAGERMYRNTSGSAKSGATEPVWPTTTGGTVVDGGITWQDMGIYTYDIGCIFCIAGSADDGHRERIGTLMGETTDAIYDAIFDFSKAKFDPSVSTNIFARLQSNMYLDLSADGTKSGQNNHLFGYSSSDNALEYQANHKLVLKVNDSGELDIGGKIAGLNGKLEATNVIQADAGLNSYENIGLFNNAAIDLTPASPGLRTLSYVSGGLSYDIAATASSTGNAINPFKVDDSGLVTLNEGLVIGSDTKKFTNGKDAVWAYGSDGNTPASRIGLKYAYPDVHLMIDSSDFGMLVRRVGVPASSSASCNEGDIAQDQNYLYMCIASNSWKRSPLESW